MGSKSSGASDDPQGGRRLVGILLFLCAAVAGTMSFVNNTFGVRDQLTSHPSVALSVEPDPSNAYADEAIAFEVTAENTSGDGIEGGAILVGGTSCEADIDIDAGGSHTARCEIDAGTLQAGAQARVKDSDGTLIPDGLPLTITVDAVPCPPTDFDTTEPKAAAEPAAFIARWNEALAALDDQAGCGHLDAAWHIERNFTQIGTSSVRLDADGRHLRSVTVTVDKLSTSEVHVDQTAVQSVFAAAVARSRAEQELLVDNWKRPCPSDGSQAFGTKVEQIGSDVVFTASTC